MYYLFVAKMLKVKLLTPYRTRRTQSGYFATAIDESGRILHVSTLRQDLAEKMTANRYNMIKHFDINTWQEGTYLKCNPNTLVLIYQ